MKRPIGIKLLKAYLFMAYGSHKVDIKYLFSYFPYCITSYTVCSHKFGYFRPTSKRQYHK